MATTLPYGTAGEITLPCGHDALITDCQTHVQCPVCLSGRGIFVIKRDMPRREPQVHEDFERQGQGMAASLHSPGHD